MENYEGMFVGGASNNTERGLTSGARIILVNRFSGVKISRQTFFLPPLPRNRSTWERPLAKDVSCGGVPVGTLTGVVPVD